MNVIYHRVYINILSMVYRWRGIVHGERDELIIDFSESSFVHLPFIVERLAPTDFPHPVIGFINCLVIKNSPNDCNVISESSGYNRLKNARLPLLLARLSILSH